MSKECILSEVVVKPKNTILKNKWFTYDTVFYNIRTGSIKDPLRDCDWVEEIDKDHIMVTDDVMYIDFKSDVSNVKEGYCSTLELVLEDIGYGNIRNNFSDVWDIVKGDFEDILSDGNRELAKSMKYLMIINIHSTYCSYVGDGDIYLDIEKVIKVNGDQFIESKIKNKVEYY